MKWMLHAVKCSSLLVFLSFNGISQKDSLHPTGFGQLHLDMSRIDAELYLNFMDSVQRFSQPDGTPFYTMRYTANNEDLKSLADVQIAFIELTYTDQGLVDRIQLQLDSAFVTTETKIKILQILGFDDAYEPCKLSVTHIPSPEPDPSSPFSSPMMGSLSETSVEFNGDLNEGGSCGNDVRVTISH